MGLTDIEIMLRLDALDAGSVKVFACTDGKTIGASVDAQIRDGSTMVSTSGYGATIPEAVRELFERLTKLESPLAYLVVRSGPERRTVRWNGGGWKPVPEQSA